MDFKIYFPSLGVDIIDSNVKSFTFSSDLYSIYTTATLELNDFAKLYYNKIKLGMPIHILFSNDFNVNSNTIYTSKMRVISFQKAPGSQTLVNDYLKLELISSWYFESNAKSGAYLGNVGRIISETIQREFPDVFNSIDIRDTDDIDKVRYQALEKPQDFIKRILKFGFKETLPVYLYNNFKGDLLLKGISDFMSEPSKATLMTITNDQYNTIPSSDKNTPKIKMDSFNFSSNGLLGSSRTTTKFTTDHFKSSRDIRTSVTIFNAENRNIQSAKATPSVTNFTNWDLTPEDAIAISIKNDFELNMNAFTLTAIIPDFENQIDIGSKVKVILPYEPIRTNSGNSSNLGEGYYIVKHMDFIFEDDIKNTKLFLSQMTYIK